MSFEDVTIMRSIPEMVIYDAVDDVQLGQAIKQLVNLDKNVYIRMPRKTRPTVFDENYKYQCLERFDCYNHYCTKIIMQVNATALWCHFYRN